MPNRALTAGDIARELGVRPVTVRKWAAEGRIPSDRTVGGHRRFSLDEVLAARSGQTAVVDELVPVLRDELGRWAVRPLNVTVFGSVARGDERPDSDVDLFVVLPTLRSASHRRSFGEQMVQLHFVVDELFQRDLREVELNLEQLERVAQGSAGLLLDVLEEGICVSGTPLRDLLLPIVERMEGSGAA